MNQDFFNKLKEKNPWEIEYTSEVSDVILKLKKKREDNHLLLNFIHFVFNKLVVFPPDIEYFTSPEPSFHSLFVGVTLTRNHLRIEAKAEYRLLENKCAIVLLKVKK